MNISNWLQKGDKSYTNPDDSKIRVYYAIFEKLGKVKYGTKITRHKNNNGGAFDESLWSEVTKEEYDSI